MTGKLTSTNSCNSTVTAKLYGEKHPSQQLMCRHCIGLKVGWRGKFFLADQNQHVSKPTSVKLQCNRYSRSALKSVLKMAKLAPSEKNVFKWAEPNRPFIWHIISQVGWLVNGVDRFLPGFTESVPIFGTPRNHWHIPKVVHKCWEWI